MRMLTLVRSSASIPTSVTVVPLALNSTGSGTSITRGRRGYNRNLSFNLPITQLVLHSIDTRLRRRMSGDATETPSHGGDIAAAAEEEKDEVVVQYVVLRRDLIDTWPLGSVVTQGCHASVAAIWEHKHDPATLRYCSPLALDSMHKVTLEVKGETQIVNLSEKLKSAGILHKLWIEQPENYPTCLATKPYPKSVVSPFFRKLKLCK